MAYRREKSIGERLKRVKTIDKKLEIVAEWASDKERELDKIISKLDYAWTHHDQNAHHEAITAINDFKHRTIPAIARIAKRLSEHQDETD